MNQVPYELDLAPSARRSLEAGPPRGLPLVVAAAIAEFVTGPLLTDPYRVGKSLTLDLDGYRSARRGAYRIIYRVEEPARVVHVVRIEHRADVYRPR